MLIQNHFFTSHGDGCTVPTEARNGAEGDHVYTAECVGVSTCKHLLHNELRHTSPEDLASVFFRIRHTRQTPKTHAFDEPVPDDTLNTPSLVMKIIYAPAGHRKRDDIESGASPSGWNTSRIP